MPLSITSRLIVVFTIILLRSAAFSQQPAPDLILLNGKVFTSTANQPYSTLTFGSTVIAHSARSHSGT